MAIEKKLDYDELVQQCQTGEIDDLQFLLAQEDLAQQYLKDIKERGEIPNVESANRWLKEFEDSLNI